MDMTPLEIDFTSDSCPSSYAGLLDNPDARVKCLACKMDVLVPQLLEHCEAHAARGEGYTSREAAGREWGKQVQAFVIVRAQGDNRFFNFSGADLFHRMH